MSLLSSMFCLFWCFTSQSTVMVMGGRSVHLITLFPGQVWTSGSPVICAHTFACNWQQPFLNQSAEGRRMTVEIISWSLSTKVWDLAGIELVTPGSAVRRTSVVRHVTDCARRPCISSMWKVTKVVTVTSPYIKYLLFLLSRLNWKLVRYNHYFHWCVIKIVTLKGDNLMW